MTRASVLIPVHDKETTLPLAVDTVLRQRVEDLEVLLIGDGVTDGVRRVAHEMVATDARVRFLDFPKGPFHGERYRHDAIEAATSEAIFYLCDDDLLLPDHVGDLLELLEDHDLVQCLNGYVNPAGEVRLYAADLADPDCVALHVSDDLRFNSVSITGTAHTRAAYHRVTRWDTTPAGQWPDHWQFRKLMRLPGFRGATSRRVTALQFPTSAGGRDTWTDQERVAEIAPWHRAVTAPGAQDDLDRLVRRGMLAQLIEERARVSVLERDLLRAHERRRTELEVAAAEVDRSQQRAETAHAAVADLRGTVEVLQGHVARLVEIRTEREEKIATLRGRLTRKDETIADLRERLRARR